MNSDEISNFIRAELISEIPLLATKHKDQLDYFIRSIQPDLEQAIGIGNADELGFLTERLLGRVARASLGPIHKERTKVVIIARAIIRTLSRVNARLP